MKKIRILFLVFLMFSITGIANAIPTSGTWDYAVTSANREHILLAPGSSTLDFNVWIEDTVSTWEVFYMQFFELDAGQGGKTKNSNPPSIYFHGGGNNMDKWLSYSFVIPEDMNYIRFSMPGADTAIAYIDMPDPIPEPATMLLFGLGLLGLAGVNRRKE